MSSVRSGSPIAPGGERPTNDLRKSDSRDPHAAAAPAPARDVTPSHPDLSTPRVASQPGNAGLLIEAIGSDRIDVRAVGSFNTDCLDRVAARLDKLAADACHLRIDFRSAVNIDDTVTSLFRQAAVTVEAAGGTLSLVGLRTSSFHDGTRPSNQAVDAPNSRQGAP